MTVATLSDEIQKVTRAVCDVVADYENLLQELDAEGYTSMLASANQVVTTNSSVDQVPIVTTNSSVNNNSSRNSNCNNQ
jgi:hypothetical protein